MDSTFSTELSRLWKVRSFNKIPGFWKFNSYLISNQRFKNFVEVNPFTAVTAWQDSFAAKAWPMQRNPKIKAIDFMMKVFRQKCYYWWKEVGNFRFYSKNFTFCDKILFTCINHVPTWVRSFYPERKSEQSRKTFVTTRIHQQLSKADYMTFK